MTDRLRGHLAMLAFSGLIAGSFPLGAMTVQHISPEAFTALRFVIATGILGAAAMATGGIPKTSFAAPWRYLLLGGSMAIYFVLMFEGLKTAEPVSAAAVFTLTPVVSGLFGYLILRQAMTRRMAAALAVGIVGALWVIFRGEVSALLALEVGRGEAIYFVGCIAHALYTPMIRKLNRGERALIFSFGAMTGAAVLLLIAGGADMITTDWANLPPIVWITLVYTTVFATALTFVLLQYASLRLPAAKVMAYTYLTPTWVICWQAALGRGLPGWVILGGVGLTSLALALLLKDEHPA